jgi:hypothetical protein
MVGRIKNNEGLNGNYLLGQKGDRIDGILCGVGNNALKHLQYFLICFPCLFKTIGLILLPYKHAVTSCFF